MAAVSQTASTPPNSFLNRLMLHSDMALAGTVILIVAMLVVPLPEFFLDTMLVLNITGAILVLLVALYNTEPLQFSIFPSLLLIMTLFRLSLNVAATKLILGNGHAGAVIEAFGKYVIGGNYIVGIIAFLIVVVVNFVVITNGAGRVAEVGARFTLDAMPGKQMSIDADMNAGLITEQQAKTRRKQIEAEADFYGAMDGSSKFVRGDAMAAVLIIIINIVGGFVMGMTRGGDIMQVLQKYTLLTIGEGLVGQIPALLISTATGLMVTRASSEKAARTGIYFAVVPEAAPACRCDRPADADVPAARFSQAADSGRDSLRGYGGVVPDSKRESGRATAEDGRRTYRQSGVGRPDRTRKRNGASGRRNHRTGIRE